MDISDWIALSQIIQNFAVAVASIGALITAIFAATDYRRNSKLERARWAAGLYEKFYEQTGLKKVRDSLDCQANAEQINELVLKGEADFTDYLNFFEFVAFLEYRRQLKRGEVEDLFGYYLGCLKRHDIVRRYARENGYERLTELLEKW